MTSTKLYEGTKYVSHSVTPVALRHTDTKRWKVEVKTEVPEGATPLPFDSFFDIVGAPSKSALSRQIDKYIDGVKKRWNKRTSEDGSWIETLKSDIKKAVDES